MPKKYRTDTCWALSRRRILDSRLTNGEEGGGEKTFVKKKGKTLKGGNGASDYPKRLSGE